MNTTKMTNLEQTKIILKKKKIMKKPKCFFENVETKKRMFPILCGTIWGSGPMSPA